MSIWSSWFTLCSGEPLGAPYEDDWPPVDERLRGGMVDMRDPGWCRLLVVDDEGTEARVVLSPDQVAGLIEALRRVQAPEKTRA